LETEVSESSWFAVRAACPPAKGVPGFAPRAHSAPAWVLFGGQPVLVREDVELMILARQAVGASGGEKQLRARRQPGKGSANVRRGVEALPCEVGRDTGPAVIFWAGA
jgi:hypothetical protein